MADTKVSALSSAGALAGTEEFPIVQTTSKKLALSALKTYVLSGLTNVDNTSDLNKPISTATQAALDAKASTEMAIAFAVAL